MSPVKVSLLLLFFLCCTGNPTSALSPPKPDNVKAGACEPEYSNTDCDSVDDTACTQDDDCSDMLKCCKKDCQMQCLNPIFY
ncbi:antileukoproteinase-like [Ranitomeya imitator]|uniref:antileukoproteinase-like n=1 Tax=Ranitomeya imitator TaxID=111125 RepID=UPI0037E6FFC2